MALVVACGAALVLAAWSLYRWSSSTPARSLGFEVTRLTTTGSVVEGIVAISPDGQFVAYAQEQSGGQSLRVRQVGDQTDVERVPPEVGPFFGVTFSKDSQQLY